MVLTLCASAVIPYRYLFIYLLITLIFYSCSNTVNSPEKDLYPHFSQPANHYKPGTWWWWNGNALNEIQIARQLNLFEEAGIVAVSIVPMELPEDVESLPDGYQEIEWMSEEWRKLLEFTIAEADKKGIEVHISIGQGWPLGDLTGKYPIETVITSTVDVTGPTIFTGNTWKLFELRGEYLWRHQAKPLIDSAIFALRLLPENPEKFHPGTELKNKME